MKVLIVETSKIFQEHLKKRLNALGYEVYCKSTGEEGMEILNSIQFDIVIIPMFLSDMKGSEFSLRFRCREDIEHVPVFMITSSEDQQEIRMAAVSGVTEIFHKDEINKLLDYMQIFLNKIQEDHLISGRILYIEDSLTVANGIIPVLEDNGFELDHFTNAEEALASLKSNDYDLVFTDIILEKRMSGIGLVRTLRRMEYRYASLPILAMTGFDDVARRIELIRVGVNDYVTTPVLNEELIARVKYLIKNKKLLDIVTKQQLRSHQMAITDQLTLLYNRHFLMEVGPKQISESHRHQIPLSIVVLDLDHFKNINDTHGHTVGDHVLIKVGELLKNSCRKEDFAVRYSGEEFLLMFQYCDGNQAKRKAEKLRTLLEALNPCDIPITASFGLAFLPLDRNYNISQLISEADDALYQAKEAGQNCVVLYNGPSKK